MRDWSFRNAVGASGSPKNVLGTLVHGAGAFCPSSSSASSAACRFRRGGLLVGCELCAVRFAFELKSLGTKPLKPLLSPDPFPPLGFDTIRLMFDTRTWAFVDVRSSSSSTFCEFPCCRLNFLFSSCELSSEALPPTLSRVPLCPFRTAGRRTSCSISSMSESSSKFRSLYHIKKNKLASQTETQRTMKNLPRYIGRPHVMMMCLSSPGSLCQVNCFRRMYLYTVCKSEIVLLT